MINFKFISLLLINICFGNAITMIQKLSQEKSLSQFYALLQGNKLAKSALMYRELTIFAPTNAAFEEFSEALTEDLVLYHLVPIARMLENLKDITLDTLKEEHPPLWLTYDSKDFYVNNARIIKNMSDILITSRSDQYGKSQVLHVIDEVLAPMSSTTTSPTAYDFISQPENWNLIPYSFNTFYKKINQNHQQKLFKNDGRNTYFIPIDQLIDQKISTRIDRDVIETSIISNRVIFVRTAFEEFSYVTRGVDRDFYNTVEFLDEHGIKITRISKQTAQKVSEKFIKILHPNIPVRNGVVHVVQSVLGIFERKLTKFPYLPALSKIQSDPNLNITAHLFKIADLEDLLDDDYKNYTIFLPTDNAWKNLVKTHGFNLTELDSPLFHSLAKKIMRRHIIVGEYYNTHRLITISKNLRGTEVSLDVGEEKIFVKIVERDKKFILTWGKIVIGISRPDYECSNGVVHLVDTPLIFDSELKAFKPAPQYNSLLFKTWNTLKKILI